MNSRDSWNRYLEATQLRNFQSAETEDYAEEGKSIGNRVFLSRVIPVFNDANIQLLMTVQKTLMVTAAGHILQVMVATPAAPAEAAQRSDAK